MIPLDLSPLIPGDPAPAVPVWRWATVTTADPVTITLDGDDDPLPYTPDLLVPSETLAVGVRVWTQQTGRRLLIVGAAHTAAVAWQPVTLDPAWAPYGSTFQVPQMRRRGDIVELRGLVRCAAGVAAEAPILTLPVGWRPPAAMLLPGVISAVTVTSGAASAGTAHTHPVAFPPGLVARVSVYPSGVVACGVALPAGAFISLDAAAWSVTS